MGVPGQSAGYEWFAEVGKCKVQNAKGQVKEALAQSGLVMARPFWILHFAFCTLHLPRTA
jgi:hypothetical protein